MSEQKQITIVKHFIYAMNARDKDFPELVFDSGKSNHPGNWGSHLRKSVCYDSWEEAYKRLKFLYLELKGEQPKNLTGISFGIITCSEEHGFTEYSAEERLAEIHAMFSKPQSKFP